MSAPAVAKVQPVEPHMYEWLPEADQQRFALAERVKRAQDVELPRLSLWNYGACREHDEPKVDCEHRACGGELFRHQRVGVSWLYVVGNGILADKTGLGKTAHIMALTALLKERGELGGRALVVCQAAAVMQWFEEYQRFVPGLKVIPAVGQRKDRIERYVTDWDVCVIGYQMLLNDLEMLVQLDPKMVVSDDVDPLRNPETKTHKAIARLARAANRVVVINATPLQIRLQELYATSVPIGGREIFGTRFAFEARYVRQETVRVWTKGGRTVTRQETVGYKNMSEFRSKIGPLYLRRTYDDIDDVRIPDVAPAETVWLDLHRAQRRKYKELQDGVLRMQREQGEEVKHVEALAKLTYGAEICSSLSALGEPDGPQASVKLDWLEDKLTGDWADEKVIVFTRFRGTVRALGERMKKHGGKTAVIWNGQTTRQRDAHVKAFWNDPDCKIIVGTTAIERSLNLQVSNIVVNFDMLLNPARMMQVLGRSRRVGSRHRRVYVFSLLCRDTQEERYLPVLERRQALADYVWGESNELFEDLSPLALLNLIRP